MRRHSSARLVTIEAAFQCYDAWSACSSKYKGSDATRTKFEQVPVEYDGPTDPVTLEMLHWRARRRAEKVIATLYSPAVSWGKPASAFANVGTDSLSEGISRPKGSEPITPSSLRPDDGVVALDYLLFCWGENVFQQAMVGLNVPPKVVDEVRRRCKERREKVDLGGRVLHRWEGKDLAGDTAALAQTFHKTQDPSFIASIRC